MCGIAGLVDFNRTVDPRRLIRMSRVLAHRGPDGEGYYHDSRIGLAYRRLAIVDVAGGEQPIADENSVIHVVFNGEIYNYRELRRDLARRGHRFRSGSDGETIPHLYEEYGQDFVELLDGDFAIALWDAREGRLILARDRAGVKPLFYHHAGPRLLFASEVKGLFASGLCRIAVDPQGLRDVFYYGQPCAPGTFWSDVRDLPPGHILAADRNGVRLHRYHRPIALDDGVALLDGPAAVEVFRETFVEAVRKRLPDEVPYGATLSGGLDSTAVVAVATKLLGASFPTSSIRLPGESLDEGRYSRLASRRLGVENVEVDFGGEEACRMLPKTLWHLEAPQWFGVPVPFMKVTNQAKELGVKVALTGDGADELLGGYSWYILQALDRRLRRLSAARPLIYRQLFAWTKVPDGAAAHALDVPRQLEVVSERFGGGAPAWFFLWSAMDSLTAPLLWSAVGDISPTPLPPPPAHTPLHQALHYEHYTRLPSWVLVLSDRLSMAHGVEVRVPFMDRALLDVAARLHPRMMLRGSAEKHVLKAAFRDVVPAVVRRRRKKPFFTPITPWYLSGPGRDLAGTYLGADGVRRGGLFEPAEVRALHAAALAGAGRTWRGMVAEWACMAIMTTHMLAEQFRPSAFDAIDDRLPPELSGFARSPLVA